ncbi:YeiH family protein [Fimbriimonas ginsengisoli]|uniref:Putative membrane protein YeiH n=1 Tax=Fimbriimonas ginsengisoli Gsoil 348 TaxID=661478 RepID=A0A068NPF4_FIMGI|nr:Putative membrane protein YeiH [Fimbriimonas ginsengisoli Gsoil 348]
MAARIAFVVGMLLCLIPLFPQAAKILPWVAPGALILGILIALTLGNPYPAISKKISKTGLQTSVVLLGFSVDLQKILKAGGQGIVFALLSITAVFGLGWLIQRLLKVRPLTSLLVSTGTAICGGSAIAAMASVTEAPQEDVSVAVGTVFLLNALALIFFPPLGHALHLTPDQFGTWAGIAIHDVASVVGAATAFDPASLETASAVKLSRVLYLIPIVIIAAQAMRRNRADGGNATPIPWFIGLFLLASVLSSYVPALKPLSPVARSLATAGFALSLFVIGLGISAKTLKAVGPRPLVQGAALWLFISVAALLAVRGL